MCAHTFRSRCSEDWDLFQSGTKALLREVLRTCDPALTGATGNPVSDFCERGVRPRGIGNRTSV